MKVLTTKGPVELDMLVVKTPMEIADNAVKVLTQFWLGDELVRQDVAVSMLMPIETTSEQGRIG